MQREKIPLQGIDFLFSWSRCKYQLPTILVVCKLSTYYTNKCKNIIFPKNCLSLHKYIVYLFMFLGGSSWSYLLLYVCILYVHTTNFVQASEIKYSWGTILEYRVSQQNTVPGCLLLRPRAVTVSGRNYVPSFIFWKMKAVPHFYK